MYIFTQYNALWRIKFKKKTIMIIVTAYNLYMKLLQSQQLISKLILKFIPMCTLEEPVLHGVIQHFFFFFKLI